MSAPSVVHPIEIVVRDAANARINTVQVLPDYCEFVVRVARLGREVSLTQTMTALGVVTGDVLEIIPLFVD